MDEGYFAAFLDKEKLGLKEEARTSIRRFVESFDGLAEKEAWTRKYLRTLRHGNVVRHELYEHVIFPVLAAGYERRDPWSLYWLAETGQNLFKAQHLYQRIGSPPLLDLFKQAFALAPTSSEIRDGLLRDLLRGFEYMAHEWPVGILYDPHQSRQEQYDEVIGDIRLARELDSAGAHVEKIAEFEAMVHADFMRSR
jgi:hypothetical protein